jgi:hypothetical protein
MHWQTLACLVASVVASPFASRNVNPSYDGYQVYSVTPASAQEARSMERRFSTYHTHQIRNSLSIAVPPEEIASFNALGLKARLINEDLGSYIRSTDKPSSLGSILTTTTPITWRTGMISCRPSPRTLKSSKSARAMRTGAFTHFIYMGTRRKALRRRGNLSFYGMLPYMQEK